MAIRRAIGNDRRTRHRPAGSGDASIFGENGTGAKLQKLTSLRLPNPQDQFMILRMTFSGKGDETSPSQRVLLASCEPRIQTAAHP
jgi:hypothetical protein